MYVKHVLKYKLFENYKSILDNNDIKDFFNNHLLNTKLKDFFDKYNYPFFPLKPIVLLIYNESRKVYKLSYKFINENLNTYTIIEYFLYLNNPTSIGYEINIKVESNIDDNIFILVDYNYEITFNKEKGLIFNINNKEEFLNTLNNSKYLFKFNIPNNNHMNFNIPNTNDMSFDNFLNLKNFLIDLKSIKNLEKINSNIKLGNNFLNIKDEEISKFKEELKMSNFRIKKIKEKKLGEEWIYFNYVEIFNFLCEINVVNELNTFLNKSYLIHEQYLYKIIKIFKQIKKEVEDEFNN